MGEFGAVALQSHGRNGKKEPWVKMVAVWPEVMATTFLGAAVDDAWTDVLSSQGPDEPTTTLKTGKRWEGQQLLLCKTPSADTALVKTLGEVSGLQARPDPENKTGDESREDHIRITFRVTFEEVDGPVSELVSLVDRAVALGETVYLRAVSNGDEQQTLPGAA